VEQQQGRLNDLQLDVNEIRIHYSELRRELRTIKVPYAYITILRSTFVCDNLVQNAVNCPLYLLTL